MCTVSSIRLLLLLQGHDRVLISFGRYFYLVFNCQNIDGSRAVYRISLSFRGSQMNRCRIIDEVSVYLQVVVIVFYKVGGLLEVFMRVF